MTHVVHDKQKLLNQLRRNCEAGLRADHASNRRLRWRVVEDHIRTHLVDPSKDPEALDAEAAAQLIEVVRSSFR